MPIRAILFMPPLALGVYEEWAYRLPQVILGFAAVVPMYLIIQDHLRYKWPIWSVILFISSGCAIYNRVAMGTGPYIFFHISSLYFFLRWHPFKC